MKFPMQITFRNLEPSAVVEEWVQAGADKLETFYDRIISCRVAVEIPHLRHRKGKQCCVRIDLTLPGKEIVIKREKGRLPPPGKQERFRPGKYRRRSLITTFTWRSTMHLKPRDDACRILRDFVAET